MPPTKTICKKVRDLVYSDRRIQVEEIAQALGISHGSVSTILHDRLGMRKLTARWVPKSLSDEQMATRASVCSALLKHFRSKDDFLLRLLTVDETWVHYYEPENKESSVGRAWVPEAKEVQDATICWQGDGHSILGRKGVIMLDFSPKRSTSLFNKSQVYNICKQQENNIVHTKHVQHLQYCGTETYIKILTLVQ